MVGTRGWPAHAAPVLHLAGGLAGRLSLNRTAAAGPEPRCELKMFYTNK